METRYRDAPVWLMQTKRLSLQKKDNLGRSLPHQQHQVIPLALLYLLLQPGTFPIQHAMPTYATLFKMSNLSPAIWYLDTGTPPSYILIINQTPPRPLINHDVSHQHQYRKSRRGRIISREIHEQPRRKMPFTTQEP